MPSKSKPDEPETCYGECEVVKFGPEPATWFAHATECADTNKNGADSADDTEKSENDDPRRKTIDTAQIIKQRKHDDPPNVENEKENTNEANKKTALIVCR